jgi:hypothetical protein
MFVAALPGPYLRLTHSSYLRAKVFHPQRSSSGSLLAMVYRVVGLDVGQPAAPPSILSVDNVALLFVGLGPF